MSGFEVKAVVMIHPYICPGLAISRNAWEHSGRLVGPIDTH